MTGNPDKPLNFNLSCPIPISDYPHVLLAHGGGGRLMNQLIERMFASAFESLPPRDRHDGAVLQSGTTRLAFTTDSYVVRPLFFPGGNIGSLAVNGTVNDLAMCGATPRWLSAGFIIEEGLSMKTLWEIVQSMKAAADAAGVKIVTGDTKVVDRGKGDGIFINTAGVGEIGHTLAISPGNVRAGDAILLSGDIGRHGIAIMAVREGLEFETTIESDCAPLSAAVAALLEADIEIHCMRDLTRGGLASALNEISEASGLHLHIEESRVPVRGDVGAACEILGFDPLYVANEGRFACFVPERDADRALQVMRSVPVTADACRIGAVADDGSTVVTLRSRIGANRIVDMLSGEQLPRIC